MLPWISEQVTRGGGVGLPLENRWQKNDYPEGKSLDPFRGKYIRLNYGKDRKVRPWEMAELYRHFRAPSSVNDIASRIGLYTGCGHLLVREAIRKNKTPSWIWVFDAIPSYFNLYRYVGAAFLRDLSIDEKPLHISPHPNRIEVTIDNGNTNLFFNGRIISRTVKIPIPKTLNGNVVFQNENLPFLNGVVDYYHLDVEAIGKSPVLLSRMKSKCLNLKDRMMLRSGLAIAGYRSFLTFNSKHLLSNTINRFIFHKICPGGWHFNHIGDCAGMNHENYTYNI